MKKLLFILLTLCSLTVMAQPVLPRAAATNTVSDSRLKAALNFFLPRYSDTTQANLTANRGIDSCGSLISTFDNRLWKRNCNPKQWAELGTGTDSTIAGDSLLKHAFFASGNLYVIRLNGDTSLIGSVASAVDTTIINQTIDSIFSVVYTNNGIVSPGTVIWLHGFTYYVTPAVYRINGITYTSNGDTVTLAAADTSYTRLDDIVLDTTGHAIVVQGTPGYPALQPNLTPYQLLLTVATVEPNSTTPAGIVNAVVYDENVEWTTGTAGTISANFNSTAQHISGTKSIAVASWSAGGAILLTNSTPLNVTDYTTLNGFLRLTTALTKQQNISVQFYLGTTAVSNVIGFTIKKSATGAWQLISLPLSQFTFGTPTFDRIKITFSSSSASTLYLDDIFLQAGVQQGQTQLQNEWTFTDGSTSVSANGKEPFLFESNNLITASISTNPKKLTLVVNQANMLLETYNINHLSDSLALGVRSVYTRQDSIFYTLADGIEHFLMVVSFYVRNDQFMPLDGTTPDSAVGIRRNIDSDLVTKNGKLMWIGTDSSINAIDTVYLEKNATRDSIIFQLGNLRFAVRDSVGTGGGGGGTWGSITGTLSDQTDLQSALDAKVPTTRTISTTSPLSGGGDLSANRTLTITQATTSTDGYLSSTNWNTFNNKQGALTLTTTGSGAATLVGNTLNVPTPSAGGTGTVTSVATNTATGITGGTITTTGTLAIDTTLISTRAWRNKGIDSVMSVLPNFYWKTTGNSGMDSSTNFIGTTDAKPLIFRVGNKRSGFLDTLVTGNTSFGFEALKLVVPYDSASNQTNRANTAVGYQALKNTYSQFATTNGWADFNVAVGYQALFTNTLGYGNAAIGTAALYSNTTGTSNMGIGHNALYSNTIGASNVGIGEDAGYNNTTGRITAIGYQALRASTTALANTAIGYQSALNTTGANNTALGEFALNANTSGYQNTAVGYNALGLNTMTESAAFGYAAGQSNSGNFNTALGNRAGISATSGSSNVSVGYLAGGSMSTASGRINIGYTAGQNYTGSNLLVIHNANTGATIYGDMSTGQVQINSASTPALTSSAQFEVISTTKGLLLPRMTKTQRDAISSPVAGLAIYQTDNTPGLRVYNGTNWMRFTETAD